MKINPETLPEIRAQIAFIFGVAEPKEGAPVYFRSILIEPDGDVEYGETNIID